MNITLRKAAALQTAIQETLRGIETKLTIQLNEFEDPQAVLDQANATALANDLRRDGLLKAMYNIRALVGQANATSGVNDGLAMAAYIDKRLGTLTPFLQEDSLQENLAVITGSINKLKEDKEGRRTYSFNSNTVQTGVLVPEQVARVKAEQQELKKQKQKLNDAILELNVRTEVELGAATLAVLTSEGLV